MSKSYEQLIAEAYAAYMIPGQGDTLADYTGNQSAATTSGTVTYTDSDRGRAWVLTSGMVLCGDIVDETAGSTVAMRFRLASQPASFDPMLSLGGGSGPRISHGSAPGSIKWYGNPNHSTDIFTDYSYGEWVSVSVSKSDGFGPHKIFANGLKVFETDSAEMFGVNELTAGFGSGALSVAELIYAPEWTDADHIAYHAGPSGSLVRHFTRSPFTRSPLVGGGLI